MTARQKVALCCIVVAAFAIRAGFAASCDKGFSLELSDQHVYRALALKLKQGEQYQSDHGYAYRPPLYPLFLWAVYSVAPSSWLSGKMAQALLDAATVALIFIIGRRLFSLRIGLLASAIVAIFPTLIVFSAQLLTETLFMFLQTIAVILLISAYDCGRPLTASLLGAVSGLAALCRPFFLLFPFFAFLWLFFFSHNAKSRVATSSAIMFAAMLITLSPWTIRNYLLFGQIVPLTTHGGLDFYLGNNPLADGRFTVLPEHRERMRGLDEVELQKEGLREGLRHIRQNPGRILLLDIKKFLLFWAPYSHPVDMVSWITLICLAAPGLVLSRSGWRRNYIPTLPVLSVIAASIVFFADPRFRVPTIPLFGLYAALTMEKILEEMRDVHKLKHELDEE